MIGVGSGLDDIVMLLEEVDIDDRMVLLEEVLDRLRLDVVEKVTRLDEDPRLEELEDD